MSAEAQSLASSDCPVSRVLGLSPVEAAFGFVLTHAGGATMITQPWAAHLSDRMGGGLDRGVLILLADHGMGHHLARESPLPSPSTTLNLRIEWLADLPEETGVYVVPEVVAFDGVIGSTRAEIRALNSDRLVAVSYASFLVGLFPGGKRQDEVAAPLPPLPPRPSAQFTNFGEFLGSEGTGNSILLPPNPDFMGMRRVGAFHGGIIGAFAEQACQSVVADWASGGPVRYISSEIRYLKPSFAADPLICEAVPIRLGNRVCTVGATLWQGGGGSAPAVQTVSTCIRDFA